MPIHGVLVKCKELLQLQMHQIYVLKNCLENFRDKLEPWPDNSQLSYLSTFYIYF